MTRWYFLIGPSQTHNNIPDGIFNLCRFNNDPHIRLPLQYTTKNVFWQLRLFDWNGYLLYGYSLEYNYHIYGFPVHGYLVEYGYSLEYGYSVETVIRFAAIRLTTVIRLNSIIS